MIDERAIEISESIKKSVENADPEWMMYYEFFGYIFARNNSTFHGGRLCHFCRRRKLWEPDTHNRWVGAVTVLEKNGWITKIGEVEPTTTHSHIGQLSLWKSNIFAPIKYKWEDVQILLEL